MHRFLVLLSVLLLTACTQQQAMKDLAGLSDQHFKQTISVKDGALDTTVTFSTEPGFVYRKGLLRLVREDIFLRGIIDKRTKARTFLVYQLIRYDDRHWRFYENANYETLSGPKAVTLTEIWSDVDCTGYKTSHCAFEEHVGFFVDEKLLRNIASRYVQGQQVAWKMKFRSRAGNEFHSGFTAAEVKGLLDKMDEYEPSM